MEQFLNEKKKGQQYFRSKIQKFMAQCQLLQQKVFITPQILLEKLNSSKIEIVSNGKINLEKYYESIQHNHNIPLSNLLQIFGNKKQIKIAQLYQMLKNYNLDSFIFEKQLQNHLFENDQLSLKKISQTLKSQGFNDLNSKDKSILIDCFDIDRDQKVTKKDIRKLMEDLFKIRNKQNL